MKNFSIIIKTWDSVYDMYRTCLMTYSDFLEYFNSLDRISRDKFILKEISSTGMVYERELFYK